LSPDNWTLRRDPSFVALLVPRLPAITFDYFNTPRQGNTTEAGPFVERNWKPETILWRQVQAAISECQQPKEMP